MKIYNFKTNEPQMGKTRTFEDFYKFIGEKPARMGIVASMYEMYTASYLTESLMNTFRLEKDRQSKYQSINSYAIEWDIEVAFIDRIQFASVPEGDGAEGTDILFTFNRWYYQKNDVMIIEGSRQQVIFLSSPMRRSDKSVQLIGKIQDSDYSAVLDLGFCQPGMDTRFLTNYQPEMHREGHVKYQSNTEKHRTYMSCHRTDVDYSAKYRSMEDQFLGIAKGDTRTSGDPVYKMNPAEKDCLDSFMLARANGSLWGKTNVDKNGKPKIFDPETQEPIISGDGIIPQIERFAGKYVMTGDITPRIMNTILAAMVTKSEQPTGNHYMFIVNTRLWQSVQTGLMAWIKDWKTNGTFMYSKESNEQIKLGSTFQSYEFAGNTVSFKVDRAFDVEYPNNKYGIFLDLTSDSKSGTPAINMFTFKGCEFKSSILEGVGGKSGTESGRVSSPIAATKIMNWGYATVGVMNPYRSYIIIGY